MARRSKEEVNEQAKKLNQRCQLFRDGLRVFSGKEHTSVEIEDETKRKCEELEDRLRNLQQKRNLISSDASIDDIERLTAQLTLWKQQNPECPVTNAAQLLMQLQHITRQQQALLAVTRGTRITLDEEVEREKQLLKETQQMKATLEDKLQQSQTTDSTSRELTHKITAMEDHYDMLKQKLKYFVHTYISLPNEEQPVTNKKRKRKRQVTLDSLWKASQEEISPEETIMVLIEQAVQNPHDPYVECDEKFAQLLYQAGIIQSHPDNPKLIRMTPFHH